MRLNDTPDRHPDRDTARHATRHGRVALTSRLCRRTGAPGVRAAVLGGLVRALLTLGTAGVAHAAGQGGGEPTVLILAQAKSVDQVLTNVRNWVVGILASLATVFLTIGGVRYILGGGEPGEIDKAKTAFRSAGVGYALAMLAPLVVSVLQGIVGG